MVGDYRKAHHIAVIDDDDSMRNAVEGLVRSIGHEATGFESADDFLASNARRLVSCIVTDIQMPGRSGLDLQKVLALEEDRTPIIFVTALPQEDIRRRAAEASSHRLLIKPFEPDDLIRCIEDAVAGSEQKKATDSRP